MKIGIDYTQKDHIKGLLIAAAIMAFFLFPYKGLSFLYLLLLPWVTVLRKDISVLTIVLDNDTLTLTTTVRTVIRKVTSYNIDDVRLEIVYQVDTTNPETKPDTTLLNIFHKKKFLLQIPAKRRFSEADLIRLTGIVTALQVSTAYRPQSDSVAGEVKRKDSLVVHLPMDK